MVRSPQHDFLLIGIVIGAQIIALFEIGTMVTGFMVDTWRTFQSVFFKYKVYELVNERMNESLTGKEETGRWIV